MKKLITKKSIIIASAAIASVTIVFIGAASYENTNSTGAPLTAVSEVKVPAIPVSVTTTSVKVDETKPLSMRKMYWKANVGASSNTKGELWLSEENPKFKESEFVELLTAIKKEDDVRSILKVAHEEINGRVLYNNETLLEDAENRTWDVIDLTPYMDERLYLRLAEVMNDDLFTADMRNAATLAKYAKDGRDVKALIYLHRIMHDLDNTDAYSKGFLVEEGYYGATHYGIALGAGGEEKEKNIIPEIKKYIK